MERSIPGLKIGVWTFLRPAAGYTLYGQKIIQRNYCGMQMQINTKFITIGWDAPTRIPKLAYKYIPNGRRGVARPRKRRRSVRPYSKYPTYFDDDNDDGMAQRYNQGMQRS